MLFDRLLDLRHGCDRLGNDLTAAVGDLAGLDRRLVGSLRVVGVFLHGRGDLLHRSGGFLQARRLFLGTLRQVGGAGGDFERGIGHLARGRLDVGDGAADALRRLIGVVFQQREAALVLRRDALGEIAFGERVQHLDQVIERLGDVLAQRVDGGADVEHEAVFALEIDALGEVAGHGRVDDAADGGLEFLGHLLHRCVAFGGGTFFLLGLFLRRAGGFFRLAAQLLLVGGGFFFGLPLRLLGQHDADVVDGAGGLAHFVLALGAGDLHRLALRHTLQQADQRAHRFGDPELPDCEGERESHGNADGGRDDHQLRDALIFLGSSLGGFVYVLIETLGEYAKFIVQLIRDARAGQRFLPQLFHFRRDFEILHGIGGLERRVQVFSVRIPAGIEFGQLGFDFRLCCPVLQPLHAL